MTYDIERLLDYGRVGLETGQYEQAREDFEKVLALDPSNREAMKGLARANEILSRREALAAEPTRVEPVKPQRRIAQPRSIPEKRMEGQQRSPIQWFRERSRLGKLAVVAGIPLLFLCLFAGLVSVISPTPEAAPTPVLTNTPLPLAAPTSPTSRPPTPTPKLSVDGIVRKVLGQGDRGVARVKDVKVRWDGLVVVEWAINYSATIDVAWTRAAIDVTNVAEALCAAGFCQGLVMSGSYPVTDVYGNTGEVTVVSMKLEAATLARINWVTFHYPDIYKVADELYLLPR